jgi:beta-N-acetylhexosaminidase
MPPEPVLGAGPPSQRQLPERPRKRPRPRPRLTAAQLAGQHIVFAFDGLSAPAALLERMAMGEASAVILFSRNIASEEQLSQLVESLHRAQGRQRDRAPLLVMVDEEGGQVTRVPGVALPSAAWFGSRRDADLSYRAARSAGAELRRIGVTVNLAPVADIARPGSVVERYERAFGRDPALVASLAGASAEGLADGGVVAAAKHFPGFGAALASTDHQPVTIRRSAAALRSVDMLPFRELVSQGIPLVMVSTAVYPALAAQPAALSSTVVQGELRGGLGFGGVVVTDDLETPAMVPLGPPEALAEAAVRAGNDLVVFAKTYEAGDRAARGLQEALAAGRLSRRALEASAARVLALRQGLRGNAP